MIALQGRGYGVSRDVETRVRTEVSLEVEQTRQQGVSSESVHAAERAEQTIRPTESS